MNNSPNVESPRANPIDGRNPDFVVLRVDTDLLTADLMSIEHIRRPGEDVPWQSFLVIRQPEPAPLN